MTTDVQNQVSELLQFFQQPRNSTVKNVLCHLLGGASRSNETDGASSADAETGTEITAVDHGTDSAANNASSSSVAQLVELLRQASSEVATSPPRGGHLQGEQQARSLDIPSHMTTAAAGTKNGFISPPQTGRSGSSPGSCAGTNVAERKEKSSSPPSRSKAGASTPGHQAHSQQALPPMLYYPDGSPSTDRSQSPPREDGAAVASNGSTPNAPNLFFKNLDGTGDFYGRNRNAYHDHGAGANKQLGGGPIMLQGPRPPRGGPVANAGGNSAQYCPPNQRGGSYSHPQGTIPIDRAGNHNIQSSVRDHNMRPHPLSVNEDEGWNRRDFDHRESHHDPRRRTSEDYGGSRSYSGNHYSNGASSRTPGSFAPTGRTSGVPPRDHPECRYHDHRADSGFYSAHSTPASANSSSYGHSTSNNPTSRGSGSSTNNHASDRSRARLFGPFSHQHDRNHEQGGVWPSSETLQQAEQRWMQQRAAHGAVLLQETSRTGARRRSLEDRFFQPVAITARDHPADHGGSRTGSSAAAPQNYHRAQGLRKNSVELLNPQAMAKQARRQIENAVMTCYDQVPSTSRKWSMFLQLLTTLSSAELDELAYQLRMDRRAPLPDGVSRTSNNSLDCDDNPLPRLKDFPEDSNYPGTSVMVRNIPNRLSPNMLLNLLFSNNIVRGEPAFASLFSGPSLVGCFELGDGPSLLEDEGGEVAAQIAGMRNANDDADDVNNFLETKNPKTRADYEDLRMRHEVERKRFDWSERIERSRVDPAFQTEPAEKILMGPWSKENTVVHAVSQQLDPVVAQFVDFFDLPQNLRGVNLGYAFLHFRSRKIAARFTELLNGMRCPGKSVKRLEMMVTTARRIPFMDGMRLQEVKPTRTMFWFDEERFPDILAESMFCLKRQSNVSSHNNSLNRRAQYPGPTGRGW
ncbi:unnamed protein product [Amoebophrya sp. A120]|nr:unnamed protein product [Amoebophrya sp. A120]|eukprot:GSA120T00003309001.1